MTSTPALHGLEGRGQLVASKQKHGKDLYRRHGDPEVKWEIMAEAENDSCSGEADQQRLSIDDDPRDAGR